MAKLASEGGYPHYNTTDGLLKAISEGCQLCLLIRDAILRVANGNLIREAWDEELFRRWNQTNGNLVQGPFVLYWRQDIGFGHRGGRMHEYAEKTVLRSEQLCLDWYHFEKPLTDNVAETPEESSAEQPNAHLKSKETLAKLTLYSDRGMLYFCTSRNLQQACSLFHKRQYPQKFTRHI